MVITIDGPSGSGKSTVAKIIAKDLNISYLDTGAMYRVVTYYLLENKIEINDQESVSKALSNIKINFVNQDVYLNDINVSKEIRAEEINLNISQVASYFQVRNFLVKMQREIGQVQSIILDGRDTGSVVFPSADYKFYFDASVEIRAQRRFEQNQEYGILDSKEEIKKSIQRRDYLDCNREHSPLVIPEGAIVIDNGLMTVQDLVQTVLRKVKKI